MIIPPLFRNLIYFILSSKISFVFVFISSCVSVEIILSCCIILFVFVFVDSWVEDCEFLLFLMFVVVLLLFCVILCFLFSICHCSLLSSLFWMSTLMGCLVGVEGMCCSVNGLN